MIPGCAVFYPMHDGRFRESVTQVCILSQEGECRMEIAFVEAVLLNVRGMADPLRLPTRHLRHT